MLDQILEQSRVNNVPKFVGIGTICSYPKFTPVPFVEAVPLKLLVCGPASRLIAPCSM